MNKLWVICLSIVAVAAIVAVTGANLSPQVAAVDVLNAEANAFGSKEGATLSDVDLAPVSEETWEIQYTAAKEQYYPLYDRAIAGSASELELETLIRLSDKWGFALPAFLVPEDNDSHGRDEGSIDTGGPDTVANCASATVIPGCPYNDSGNFDGDNDCSVISVSPSNEVFYTFTPTVTGAYQLRARSQSGGVAAIRVVSGGCCSGAVNVAFSSSTVATDCPRPDSAGNEPSSSTTYIRAVLTAGVQYWIHVGTSSATVSTAAYQFNFWCVPCPVEDLLAQPEHDVCAEAVNIACGDSIMGDSAVAATPDWYRVVITGSDSIIVNVAAREWGHCTSGFYPSNTAGTVDARFTLYKDNGGPCPGDSVNYDDVGSHGYATCSEDAIAAWCGPGTYYIKVWNFSGLNAYILKIRCVPCPPPQDCEVFFPCSTPAEIEPNNICADSNNFIRLNCTDGVVQEAFGTICPQADVDYYFIPGIPAGRQVDIQLFEGDNCDLPTGGLAMRGATGVGFVCAAATGTATRRYLIGNACAATAGGWFGVVRSAGPEQRYKITVACNDISPACPNVVLPKQYCQGPCVGVIRDVTVMTYTQTVTLNEVIDDVNVRINATHTFDGDVIFRLISPWADTLNLVNRRGGGGDNFQVLVLDDEAGTPISAGAAPFNGSFIPEEPLAQLDGNNAQGNWTLVCRDTVGGDSGFVLCWCLEFESHSPCTSTDLVYLESGRDLVPQYSCFDVCPGSSTLIRVCGPNGDPLLSDKPPIASLSPGCDPANSGCDRECTAGSSNPTGTIDPMSWVYEAGCWELSVTGVDAGCICFALEDFLAVDLISFDAMPGDRSVTLNWVTASENGNDRFEIERDGELVQIVDSRGNEGTGATYSWTDRNLTNGRSYAFSLIAVDVNGQRVMLGTMEATPSVNAAVITEYALWQNYPNPFNPETNIEFDMPEAGFVSLTVFNISGQKVATIANNTMDAGRHVVSFRGSELPSGLYFYRLQVNGFTAQQKMVLMK